MADPVGIDAGGLETLREAAAELLDDYPGLSDEIPFEEVSEYGITFSADSGALVITERRDITDYVKQTCQFPFFVVCRASSSTSAVKERVYELLDDLGRWLCMESTDYSTYPSYPTLAGKRKITRITRSNPYGVEPNQDGTQDWLLPVTINYTNEFQLW